MIKNKINSTVLTLILLMGVLQVQAQQYVRVVKEINDQQIKPIYKGEIYKLDGLTDQKKYFTVNNLTCWALNDVEVIDAAEDMATSKNDFVKKYSTSDSLYVNLSSLENTDTIFLIGTEKIPFLKNKTTTIKSIGDTFRLIIPNAVTIWYIKDKLEQYIPPTLPEEIAPIANKTEYAEFVNEVRKLIIIFGMISILVSVLIGVLIFLLSLKNHRKKELSREIEIVYDGTNLENWAKAQNTTIELLKVNNPDYIDIWEQIKEEDTAWDTVQTQLLGKKIVVVKVENQIIQGDYINTTDFDTKITKFEKNVEKLLKKAVNQLDILMAARYETVNEKTENNIIARITEKLSTNDDKNRITELTKEFDKKNEDIQELNKKLTSTNNELNTANLTLNDLKSRIEQTKNIILPVDFLKDYAGKVFDYLNYCQETVYKTALKLYDNLQEPNKAGMLLLNFEIAIKDLQIGKLQQILGEIKERGVIVTSNQDFIKSFSQPQSDEEKMREFKRYLFDELLVKYSSNLLILTEAFRNLNRFGVAIGYCLIADFPEFVQNIQTKAGSIGMTIKYVPLFESCTNSEYINNIKVVDKKISRAYSDIQLQKDDIAEILSYGIVTEFSKTQTQIKIV